MKQSERLQSVDALRGFVMIVMALDHVREYFHQGAMQFNPEDLSRTTALLFFTRWITHICAPTFMLTAGLATWLRLQRPGADRAVVARRLVTRGLGLVLLELTVFQWIAFFDPPFHTPIFLTVLWALGWSMVALGGLIFLPLRLLTMISLAGIALHNLFPIRPSVMPIAGIPVVFGYPLIPWIFVMSAGYCLGPLLDNRKRLWQLGALLTAGFFALRFINVYGDPSPWTSGLLSFLRTTKYPPSLQFLLMTLGPALLLLGAWHRIRLIDRHPLLVFGRTPLFYFLGHFLLAHLLTVPFAWFTYGRIDFLIKPPPSMGGPAALYPTDYGWSLGTVYLVWLLVVLLMYPACLYLLQRRERTA